jgi:hypothetical protein
VLPSKVFRRLLVVTHKRNGAGSPAIHLGAGWRGFPFKISSLHAETRQNLFRVESGFGHTTRSVCAKLRHRHSGRLIPFSRPSGEGPSSNTLMPSPAGVAVATPGGVRRCDRDSGSDRESFHAGHASPSGSALPRARHRRRVGACPSRAIVPRRRRCEARCP